MKNYKNKDPKSIFFGTPDISVYFLEKLKNLGFSFDLVITNPDALAGRKKVLTAPPVKVWAQKNNIEVLQPEKITKDFTEKLNKEKWDFFFVLAYGKILPQELLDIPALGTVNLHPSLLPKYRGPSPIMSAILDDKKEIGFSLMLLDSKMDHGPIIAQEKVTINEWERNDKMEKFFAELGAEKFSDILEDFAKGKILPKEQDHAKATFCQKFSKQDMELAFPFSKENARKNFLKYCAFPKPFFFFDKKTKKGSIVKNRAVVTKAIFENNNFIVEKVIPEGKKEQEYIEKNFL